MFVQLPQALPPYRRDQAAAPAPLRMAPSGRRSVDLDDGRVRPNAALELAGAVFGYAGRAAVAPLTGVFAAGSLTALIGPNGAGKSTLLKGLAGQLAPLQGRVLRPASARVAYLPQQSELDSSFPATVGQTVAFGLSRSPPAGRADRKARVAEALGAVGLGGFEKVSLGALSGGQRQRVLLARLILQDADIVLLDEPFAGLAADTTEAVLALFAQWAQAGRIVAAAVHDIDQALAHFPTVVLLGGRAPVWGATGEVLGSPQPLYRAVTPEPPVGAFGAG
ncbi:MAG: transporter [Phenylobacterium sp.]|jgi:zinc/manganese transport system ATP-binding protein|uniref:metal ABC transporter ATP-binding protein n=1 Tax=Phenylobacterium sp. TaxID=1871053 RepID=UPI0026190E9D|nr:ATP-binding cassette domain-containing protein [Phenylobacterium sp.]MDB5427255.1 transporter [Phenylobacterium sp.]MDB5436669.1 transporter [Phenylobacterium sp.]MDB5496681.1 transporter [Phenylobacterium sp.]